MGRMMGYARVSTSDQDVSLQWEALRRAGCQVVYLLAADNSTDPRIE